MILEFINMIELIIFDLDGVLIDAKEIHFNADGKRIYAKSVQEMWGLGTPEDLEYFIKTKEF